MYSCVLQDMYRKGMMNNIIYTTTTKEPYPSETCGANGEWCGCGMSDEYYERKI